MTRQEEGLGFVRRMYLPRLIALPLGAVAIGTVLWTKGAGLLAWVALALGALAWPHLARWLGARSANPYGFERRSMMVDTALGGFWIGLMEFNLLPSVVVLSMLTMDKIAVGGVPFLLRAAVVLVAACAAGSALTGFAFEPHTSMLHIAGTLPLLVAYPATVGIITYNLALRVRDQNRLLSEALRIDGLTRLLTRQAWEEAVAGEFERCRKEGGLACVLMLDIDHFKAINDRHGHPVGDAVIRSVARILREGLRGDDVAGRYGGEEFGVLMPHTGAAGAAIGAERLRRRIEAAVLDRGAAIHGTVSIGLAELSAQAPDHGAWIAHADQALYAAKRAGRNRCVRFEAAAR